MGYWGYKPHEGDGAQDLVLGVTRGVHKRVHELFRKKYRGADASFHKWDRVGVVCQLVEWSPGLVDEMIVDKALSDLDDLEDDEEWIETWKSPAQVRKAIKAMRRKLEAWS